MSGHLLITGASSGIGEAISRRLGARRPLILSGRSQSRLEALRAEIAGDHEHLVWPFDLARVDELGESLSSLLQSSGAKAGGFVHCAGVVRVLPVRDIDPDVAGEMMAVNVLSAVQIVRTLVKRRTNGDALRHIVFLSSTWAMRGRKGQSVYSATKGALDAMMRSLAVELAPAVRVNSIVAGGVPTAMSRDVFENPELIEKSRQEYPLRLGEVKDIVDAAEFLLSEQASWITGTTMVVDGGLTAR